MKKSGRNSNIELLRIILIIMVITLHFNNGDIGGDCLKTKEFTIRNRHSKIPIWDT